MRFSYFLNKTHKSWIYVRCLYAPKHISLHMSSAQELKWTSIEYWQSCFKWPLLALPLSDVCVLSSHLDTQSGAEAASHICAKQSFTIHVRLPLHLPSSHRAIFQNGTVV